MNVLYVEDDEEIRSVFIDFLKRRFEQVHVAENGDEGLASFIEHKPDLVITDLKMPKRNGIEMIHAIRKVDIDTPIILISAYAEEDLLTESVKDLIQGHLTKPIDGKQFKQLLLDIKENKPRKEIDEAALLSTGTHRKHSNEESTDEVRTVVGIGASAGGLEALSALVAGLPERNHTAYIIAQHLSPTHKTMLVDLLSRTSSVLVKAAQHEQTLQSDTIYITPPNNNIEVTRDGRISLSEQKGGTLSPKPSINQLFISIAEHYAESAIGIPEFAIQVHHHKHY